MPKATKRKTTEAPTPDGGDMFGPAPAQDAPKEEGAAQAAPASQDAPAPRATKAVAVRKAPPPPTAVTPSPGEMMNAVLQAATNPAVDPVKMQALLDIHQRLLADHRRMAFDRALAEMQPHLPVIDRKGRIEVREKTSSGARDGKIIQNTPYAKWEDIAEKITPILGEFGFSLRFVVEGGANDVISVVGVLAHSEGHRETSPPLKFAHDTTGSKNGAQAIVSAISYGKRTVAGTMLNFVSRGEDDDAKSTGAPKVIGDAITPEEHAQLIELCEAEGCKEADRKRLVNVLNNRKPKGHPDMPDLTLLPKSRWEETVTAVRNFGAALRKHQEEKVG